MQIITLGYAIPGPVVAIAVLILFATLDNFLNQILISTFNYDVGLLLVELFLFNIFLLYKILTVSSRTIKSGLDSLSIATDDAARSLGANTKRYY